MCVPTYLKGRAHFAVYVEIGPARAQAWPQFPDRTGEVVAVRFFKLEQNALRHAVKLRGFEESRIVGRERKYYGPSFTRVWVQEVKADA